MVFSSIVFLFYYLPAVLAVYYIVPKRYRNLWLFVVNLVFYGWGEPVYVLLMVFSICINYASGRMIGRYRTQNHTRAKAVLCVNTAVNLLMLIIFKYADLLISTANRLFGTAFSLPGLALPIGISFYTFQTMSYPIDVYRGDARVQNDFIRFGTFVALFPQLIAGPIVRYKDIADQLESRTENLSRFASGVERFTIGLGKKVLIANNIGALWDVYAAAESLSTAGAWLGALAFSLQLYFDFSGYSDMAIGLGRMLGFEFLENFNYPYISRSITEFWRRWHISLGTWFRDYLYIPLGGNRRGLPRQLFNILVVWALTGLWHGANWTFLFWGLYYALFLVIEKLFLLKKLQKSAIFSRIYTALVVVFGWMLFQLDTVPQVLTYWRAMIGLSGVSSSAADLYYLRTYLPVMAAGLIGATPLPKKLFQSLPDWLRDPAGAAMILIVLIASTAYLVNSTYNPFLYFRF